MTDDQKRWKAVGQAIADRIDELDLTKAAVLRAARLSDKTLTGYLNGAPIRRPDKRRGLCLALRWPTDAIDRLFAGEDPADLVPVDMDDDDLEQQIGRAMQDVIEARAARDSIVEQLSRWSVERRRLTEEQEIAAEAARNAQMRYSELLAEREARQRRDSPIVGDQLDTIGDEEFEAGPGQGLIRAYVGEDPPLEIRYPLTLSGDKFDGLQEWTWRMATEMEARLEWAGWGPEPPWLTRIQRALETLDEQFAVAADTGKAAKTAKRASNRPSPEPNE